MPVLNVQGLIQNRVEAIRKYHEEACLPRAELDVSGGIDSAIMLALLARALGPNNITAVYSSIHSSTQSLERARAVSKVCAVPLIELDLGPVYDALVKEMRAKAEAAGYSGEEIVNRIGKDNTVLGSLRSMLRAPVGRGMNRLLGDGIRHGTGNEDEDRWLRFFQKGGDGEVDTNPVAMLSKGEIYQMAVALEIPREIIDAKPTPDLWGIGEEHNDEDELTKYSGVEWSYSRVDSKTGEYTKVGTIERLSRFLDHEFVAWFDGCCRINGTWLFAKEKGVDDISGPWEFNMDALVKEAMPFFPHQPAIEVRAWLLSARKWDATTRHKMNPNCPALGTRDELLVAGLITDKLPELSGEE